MPRYIDLDKQLVRLYRLNLTNEDVIKEFLLSADVVERKSGKWVVIMDEPTITFDECKCSECGAVEYFNKGWKKFKYCPNCGAEMRKETEDE